MISVHASAVCRVLDGYTGREIVPSALLCALDGVPCRPVGKEGGYLVLTNLSHGLHRLSLRCRGYQEEWVEFEADSGTCRFEVTMKPGPAYPFRQTVTRLMLTVSGGNAPAAGRTVWLAAPGPELKLAQTKAQAGDKQFRLYCKGTAVPGVYLLEDGADSEIVSLQSLEGETGLLSEPLQKDHGRGKRFLPAQRYHTGEDGALSAVFRFPCTVQIFTEEAGLAGSVELSEGDNQSTVTL